jgi:hypothetical protein
LVALGEKDNNMSRELKRVALDFEWPRNKAWKGYINDAGRSELCAHCDGTGSTGAWRLLKALYVGDIPFQPESTGSAPFTSADAFMQESVRAKVERAAHFYGKGQEAVEREAARMAGVFNGMWAHHLTDDDVAALIAAGELKPLTHIHTKNGHWRRKKPAYIPTAREVNEWLAVNWTVVTDCRHMAVVIAAECERQGHETVCPHCKGETLWASEADRLAHENWTETEPPAGEGYQLWETVSEGSPISPVFATAHELARWMSGPMNTRDRGTSYRQWMEFIEGPGWAPSMILSAGKLETGIDALCPDPDKRLGRFIPVDRYERDWFGRVTHHQGVTWADF